MTFTPLLWDLPKRGRETERSDPHGTRERPVGRERRVKRGVGRAIPVEAITRGYVNQDGYAVTLAGVSES